MLNSSTVFRYKEFGIVRVRQKSAPCTLAHPDAVTLEVDPSDKQPHEFD
ncbi:hypothetical protein IQ249_12400 [Lusitaniella coriacea LEGE 07157]|uniref:Uncharacterized protein n=1 Tax=Lusitaniella coriacea LEGE 07157 TaxID=945747 RepID=A0A8J7DWY0_9CYAN|nr:hypothetical protein [Lusitaniella coriacea]MBE9116701.1 hypothetical protein [Lusitaniella coriacea LEGE 07157]